MKPYKSKFQEGDPYLDRNPDEPWVLPPRSQAAGSDDISKWSDEKAKLEIQKLKMYISRLRTRGDDSSIQEEIRYTYRKIRHIEEVKWPEKAAKKKVSSRNSREKAYQKRVDVRNKKISSDGEKFSSSSTEDQANYIMSQFLASIRRTQDFLKRAKDSNYRKELRKEEETLINFRSRLKTMFPNLDGRNYFRNLSRNDDLKLSSLINDSELKTLVEDYEEWYRKKYGA